MKGAGAVLKHPPAWSTPLQKESTMTKPRCSVDGCEAEHKARGLCSGHYQRWRNGLEVSGPLTVQRAAPEIRFWAKVDKSSPDGCWLWTGSRPGRGYGHFGVDGRIVRAHRWAYEAIIGPIPSGMEIDHLCRVRHCVNPEHLQPVAHSVNYLRGMHPSAITFREDVCRKGHPLTPDNVYCPPRQPHTRECRICKRAAARAGYLRRKVRQGGPAHRRTRAIGADVPAAPVRGSPGRHVVSPSYGEP